MVVSLGQPCDCDAPCLFHNIRSNGIPCPCGGNCSIATDPRRRRPLWGHSRPSGFVRSETNAAIEERTPDAVGQKWTSISSQSSSRRSNRHVFVPRQPKCGHWSCRRLRPIYCRDGPMRTHPDTTTQKAKLAPCRTTPAAVSRLFRRPARCRRANLAGTSRAHRSRPRSQPAV